MLQCTVKDYVLCGYNTEYFKKTQRAVLYGSSAVQIAASIGLYIYDIQSGFACTDYLARGLLTSGLFYGALQGARDIYYYRTNHQSESEQKPLNSETASSVDLAAVAQHQPGA